MADHFLVAAVQMVSTDDVGFNIERASHGIRQAADKNAQLVVLPEYFCLLSPRDEAKKEIAEDYGDGPIQTALSNLARETGVWLVGGTLPIKSGQNDKVFNTQLVFSPDGKVIARYDKIHLFNFSQGNERYNESRSVVAGQETRTVEMPFGRVGLSTCYDLRFPELYRALGTVDLIVVPAAFTETTGRAHWEPLLRARAIENQAYVLAAAQGGEHPGARRTWGHSMLIDPWGEIMAEIELGEGVISGEVRRDKLRSVRSSLPALQNRVL
ncbi:MAG: carbon-nitrogen hydrolase family protein [Burkholderiaceae bacterium]|nr:carbon-nitrogen hydrolase family protein [Burkholderiaceae bacterium]MCD8518094.1 carbon-nitrogen hydrolase family protein [Burkholderiaceae bacterium]